MNKIELLAPAGNLEKLKFAFMYGADACYIGGRNYSLRANATNFNLEEIKEACTYAHSINKKVYVTVNIVFHDEDLNGLEEYLKYLDSINIDGIIASDITVIKLCQSLKLNLSVCLSTQASTLNSRTVKFWQNLGVTRVVLAREVNRNDIKKIIDTHLVDIEVFIHGAMCTFYSGRCVLSNYLTNRDSNRGGCSQVCRFAFSLEDGYDKFTMATKDLNMSGYIKDLIDIGVSSLKVEGRMRSLYYLATVIGTYRKIIDACYSDTLNKEFLDKQVKILGRVANRETSTHYFLKKADFTDQYYTGRQEISNQDFLGLVTSYDRENKILTLSERNYFEKGWKVEVFTPRGDVIPFTIDEVYDEALNPIGVARHPEEVIKLKLDTDKEIEQYSMMRLSI